MNPGCFEDRHLTSVYEMEERILALSRRGGFGAWLHLKWLEWLYWPISAADVKADRDEYERENQ